jgi:hypothetical protein
MKCLTSQHHTCHRPYPHTTHVTSIARRCFSGTRVGTRWRAARELAAGNTWCGQEHRRWKWTCKCGHQRETSEHSKRCSPQRDWRRCALRAHRSRCRDDEASSTRRVRQPRHGRDRRPPRARADEVRRLGAQRKMFGLLRLDDGDVDDRHHARCFLTAVACVTALCSWAHADSCTRLWRGVNISGGITRLVDICMWVSASSTRRLRVSTHLPRTHVRVSR